MYFSILSKSVESYLNSTRQFSKEKKNFCEKVDDVAPSESGSYPN